MILSIEKWHHAISHLFSDCLTKTVEIIILLNSKFKLTFELKNLNFVFFNSNVKYRYVFISCYFVRVSYSSCPKISFGCERSCTDECHPCNSRHSEVSGALNILKRVYRIGDNSSSR